LIVLFANDKAIVVAADIGERPEAAVDAHCYQCRASRLLKRDAPSGTASAAPPAPLLGGAP
jgi:hypothetical protein